jgi:acetyltransferase
MRRRGDDRGGEDRHGRAAPILVGWTGQATAGRQRRRMAEAGSPSSPRPKPRRGGAMHLAADRRNRAAAAELPSREVLELAPDRGGGAAHPRRARAAGRLG